MTEFQAAQFVLTFDLYRVQMAGAAGHVVETGPLTLERFAVHLTQWIHQHVIRPIVNLVAIECPRPGPRFKVGACRGGGSP